jgi:hypothetical protein
VTDLPRRSYPLVVAPPGGFEQAVRRGRSLRRRRVGGSSGVALVLVGALGWGVLGGSNGVDRIEPTRDDRQERSAGVPGSIVQGTPTPLPSASATIQPGVQPTRGTGTLTGARPSAGPTSVVVAPTRKPGGTTTRRYAKRSKIEPIGEYTNTDPNCISPAGQWCASADVDTTQAIDGIYTFTYTLCRPVNSTDTTITFDYTQPLDFSATDVAHADTVWTWSAGQPRVRDETEVRVDAGNCIGWKTVWNGLDDFGYTPPQGTYTLHVTPMAREDLPEAQREFEHQ